MTEVVDDEVFLEQIIAAERVEDWLAAVRRGGGDAPALRRAVAELAAACARSEAYCVEARRAGAVPALTRLLSRAPALGLDPDRPADAAVLDAAAAAIAACSGPMACGGRVRALRFGGRDVRVREGALGDGVGAKVWAAAAALCAELAAHPHALVAGRTVLELGAGCGACGALAAHLGARAVVLSDYVDALLINLAETARLNSGGDSGVADGVLSVRFFDWRDALRELEGDAGGAGAGDGGGGGAGGDGDPPAAAPAAAAVSALDGPVGAGAAPALERGRRFDLVLGSDVLYEWEQCRLVPAAVATRLAPGGRALLVCAVRDAGMHAALLAGLAAAGLRAGSSAADPGAAGAAGGGGLRGRAGEYEGGWRLLAVEHAAAPAAGGWHRPGLFPRGGEGEV